MKFKKPLPQTGVFLSVMKHIFFLLMFFSFLFSFLENGEARSLEERIQSLEEKLIALEQTYFTNNQEVASAVAKAETLQREALSLEGKMETTIHLTEERFQILSKRLDDLDSRFSGFKERIDLLLLQTQKALKKIDPQSATSAEMYQKGFDAFEQGNYLEATAAFKNFLQKYPRNEFASKAQFWIGESFFRLRDFRRAIKEFQFLVEKYPTQEQVPGAILKQGFSFVELRLHEEAKAFFEKLIKDFSTTEEAIQAKEALQKLTSPIETRAPLPTNPYSAPSSPVSYPEKTIQEERTSTETKRP